MRFGADILNLRSLAYNIYQIYAHSFAIFGCALLTLVRLQFSDALWGKYILDLRSFAIFNLVCNAFYIVLILTSRLCMNTKGGDFI